MENQTTAPAEQSEQTTEVVQNNTVITEVAENQETNFKDLIPEGFKEEKALDNFNNMEDFVMRIGMKYLKNWVLQKVQMIINITSKIKNWTKRKLKNLIKLHIN